MATDRQMKANRANAKKSTGPVTRAGKKRASGNAVSHGLLSRALVLPSESQQEFDALVSQLASELGAVGTLELALVERIAIAMWRQKRLVKAEHQDIVNADAAPSHAKADRASHARERSLCDAPDAEIFSVMLSAPQYSAKLDQMERELLAIGRATNMGQAEFTRHYPAIAEFFPIEFPDERDRVPANTFGDIYPTTEHANTLMAEVQRHKEIRDQALGRVARNLIPPSVDTLVRYQSALDNEWYKAMRAFREAQAARLRTLDAVTREANCETNPN